jgi:hypothetical protein
LPGSRSGRIKFLMVRMFVPRVQDVRLQSVQVFTVSERYLGRCSERITVVLQRYVARSCGLICLGGSGDVQVGASRVVHAYTARVVASEVPQIMENGCRHQPMHPFNSCSKRSCLQTIPNLRSFIFLPALKYGLESRVLFAISSPLRSVQV